MNLPWKKLQQKNFIKYGLTTSMDKTKTIAIRSQDPIKTKTVINKIRQIKRLKLLMIHTTL